MHHAMQQQERGELAPKEMRFNHGPYSQLICPWVDTPSNH